MDQKAQLIEQKMREARERLVDKLHALENRADRKIARPANEAVQTVEAVKASFSDAIHFMDGVRNQVSQRPWTTLGVSVLAGAGLALLINRGFRASRSGGQLQVVPQPAPPVPAPDPTPPRPQHPALARAQAPPPERRQNGHSRTTKDSGAVAKIKSEVAHALEEPLEELKTVAVDAARGLAWGLLSQALPGVFDANQMRNVAPQVRPQKSEASTTAVTNE